MTDPSAPSNSSKGPQGGSRSDDFAARAARKQSGIIVELRDYLAHSRAWWLIPIAVAVLLLGFALLVGTGPLAPLLYALF